MATAKKTKSNPPLILELTERRPSSFVMKGTENSENPDRLDCPSEYLMRNTSVVVVNGVRKETRYIAGCPYYLVEDQIKHNFKPNPREDTIAFTFGRLTVEREGRMVGLYDFLANHANNRSVDKDKRPSDAVDVFFQINTEGEAEVELDTLEDEVAAMAILGGLREKNAGKDNGYKYDSNRIEYISKLLGVVGMDTDAEKLRVLTAIAKEKPAYFVALLKESQSDLRVEIVTARELGVISTDGEQASFIDEQKPFYRFVEKKNQDKRMEELVKYFASEEGEIDLNVLRTKVAFAKDKSLETK